jgi:hypothetical protein
MKKLLVIAFLFVLTTINAQTETFVYTYTKSIAIENDVAQNERNTFLTVIFNKNGAKIIEFIFSDGESISFSQISDVRNGKTHNGITYQIIDVVDLKFGSKAAIQLFDDDKTIRLHYSKGNYTEFYEK